MADASPTPTNAPTTPAEPIGGGPRKRRGLLWRFARVAVASYLAWCGVMLLAQGKLLFQEWAAGPAAAAAPAGDGAAEQLWITTADGDRVEALYYPAPGATGAARRPAVIFTHGNAELIQHCADVARMYNDMGVSVLLPEYRGYGNSGGSPSQRGITEDLAAFYDLLAARAEVDPAAIILHGRSLGGGAAAQLAAKRRPAALVLQSTFTSVASFSWAYGVPPLLALHPFRTDRVLPTLAGVPILIMHGRSDTVVPVEHGRRLRELAPHATYYETDDGHMTFSDGAAYRATLLGFLSEHGLASAPE